MKQRFTKAQIVGFLREVDAGVKFKDLCCRHGFSEASYYLWRSKFGGTSVSDAKRLKIGLKTPALDHVLAVLGLTVGGSYLVGAHVVLVGVILPALRYRRSGNLDQLVRNAA